MAEVGCSARALVLLTILAVLAVLVLPAVLVVLAVLVPACSVVWLVMLVRIAASLTSRSWAVGRWPGSGASICTMRPLSSVAQEGGG